MKVIKTLTVELETEAETIGQMWGISEQRAEEIHEWIGEAIKASKNWGELYKRILEELDGNEVMYAFGAINYIWGQTDGKDEAIREFIAGLAGEN